MVNIFFRKKFILFGDKIKIVLFCIAILFCNILGGCNLEQKTGSLSGSRMARAQKAYGLARQAIMKESALNIDALWALQQILELYPDEELQQFIDKQIANTKKHHSSLLINPNASRCDLPEKLPSGIARFAVYLKSPFGKPKDRAVSLIEKFLNTEEAGYILTHQFLVLEWGALTGLELPEKLNEKRSKILEEIYQEQFTDNLYFDLYAERAAILLHFTKTDSIDAAIWIDTIIESQLETGNWKVASTFIAYDGQTAQITPPASHTNVLALWALRSYINNY